MSASPRAHGTGPWLCTTVRLQRVSRRGPSPAVSGAADGPLVSARTAGLRGRARRSCRNAPFVRRPCLRAGRCGSGGREEVMKHRGLISYCTVRTTPRKSLVGSKSRRNGDDVQGPPGSLPRGTDVASVFAHRVTETWERVGSVRVWPSPCSGAVCRPSATCPRTLTASFWKLVFS